MVDVSELVSQMHETLSNIHEIISSLSVKDHESKLDELERRQETALTALHSAFEHESRSSAQKRQAQLAGIAEQRRLEDEEREAKRLHEDDELRAQLAQQDKDRQVKLEREEIEMEESTYAMIATVEEAAKQAIEEGKVKLTVLEEKRKELNRRIDEQLRVPLPEIPKRRKRRGRGAVSTIVADEPRDRGIDDKEDTEASTEGIVPKLEGDPSNSKFGKSNDEVIPVLSPDEMTPSKDATTTVGENDMQPAAQLPSPNVQPIVSKNTMVEFSENEEQGAITTAAVLASQELPVGLDHHVAQVDGNNHEVQKNEAGHIAVEDDTPIYNAQIPAEQLDSEVSPIFAIIDHVNDNVAQPLSDDHAATAVVEKQPVPEIVVTGASEEAAHEAKSDTSFVDAESFEKGSETDAEREPAHHDDLHKNEDSHKTHDFTIVPEVISEEHGVHISYVPDAMVEDHPGHSSAYGQAMQTALPPDYVDYGASYYASTVQQSIYLPPVLHEASGAPTESFGSEMAQRSPVRDATAKLGQDVLSEDDDEVSPVSEHSLSSELDKFPQTPTSIIAASHDEEPGSPSFKETGDEEEGQQGPAPGEIAPYDEHMHQVVPPRVEQSDPKHGDPTTPQPDRSDELQTVPITPPRQLPGRAEWETPAYSDSDAEDTAVFAPRDVTNKSWQGSGVEATPGSVHGETTGSWSSTPESAPHDEPLPSSRGQPLAKLDYGHVVAVDGRGFAIEAASIADEHLQQPRTSERLPSVLSRSRPTSLASTNLFKKMRNMFELPEAGNVPSKRDSSSSSTSQLSTPRPKQMPHISRAETDNPFEYGAEADSEDDEVDDAISERSSLLQAASINTSANS
ncbi:hypothetical protein CMQ_2225 [Grosmannia clavigera kw1407]|uniref:Uncharacterized protein n=1 Tax=Grosmannia clavigera (strain kw1407 / UAMH 11150) TaxID=655863 RepID=F0XIZ8_GROCL|nr:uncharacterized protein CMQ_2225 [Grosmannia clavigera kw1407]EFX02176.1 hypothetical protein CMQ_2225 [Grosmannia clavigera kw1407]